MSKPRDNDKMDIMDATRYLMASLEANLYGTKRKPYAGLMTLLCKFNIKSAMLDNRPLHIKDQIAIMKDVTFSGGHINAFTTNKKPCKRCPSNKCKNCPVTKK